MNFYPEQVQAILIYIRHLNAAENETEPLEGEGIPFMASIKLTDNHGTDYGELRDEIGGSWSWFPPEPKVAE